MLTIMYTLVSLSRFLATFVLHLHIMAINNSQQKQGLDFCIWPSSRETLLGKVRRPNQLQIPLRTPILPSISRGRANLIHWAFPMSHEASYE